MKNILLVEDAKDYQLMINHIFSDEAYSLRIADSAASAMTLIEAKTPDLVLLDISLPDENGLDFGVRLQENAKTRDIPIIYYQTI
jgi:CheY-like chemotaxis protein